MIINFAVIGDIERAVFIRHRLMAGGNINNAQTAVTQSDVAIYEETFIIWAAMLDHVAHPLQNGTRNDSPGPARKCDSINSAH
jgi:hypothetical protein